MNDRKVFRVIWKFHKYFAHLNIDQESSCFHIFQSLDSERTWWRLFQKRVVRIKFDIYLSIPQI
jgi:hypothetical protein